MRARTVLTEDGSGQWTLVISLREGRRQLSLAQEAVELLREGFDLGVGTVVPDAVVPVLVATGDARLPDQEDPEATLSALPSGGSLTDRQRATLAEYLASTTIDADAAGLVERVVAGSPVAAAVDPDELTADATDRPEYAPDDRDGTAGDADADELDVDDADDPGEVDVDADDPGEVDVDPSRAEAALDDPGRIPGIGETRAESLSAGGYATVRAVAGAAPDELASLDGVSAAMAQVAVEGARELVGNEEPTAERLAARTGVDAETFEGALSALAASGVPPSEAGPVLERLYGPSLVDVEGVTGKQAYYLWEAGYRTAADLAAADPAALEEVSYVGAKTAPGLVEAAREVTGDDGT